MKRLLWLLLLNLPCFGQQLSPPQIYSGSITATNSNCTATSCMSANLGYDISTIIIQVTGTWSATLQFEASADNGTTRNSLQCQPLTPGAMTSSTTANGVWVCDAPGFTQIYVRASAYTSGTAVVQFTMGLGVSTVGTYPIDPCASPNVQKSSAAINISSATTTALVASVAGQKVYACGIVAIFTSGTAPTLVFKSGTQTTTPCDTGTVTYTGTIPVPVTSGQGLIIGSGNSTFSPTAAGAQLCVTSGGTTPNVQGWLTYVQQ